MDIYRKKYMSEAEIKAKLIAEIEKLNDGKHTIVDEKQADYYVALLVELDKAMSNVKERGIVINQTSNPAGTPNYYVNPHFKAFLEGKRLLDSTLNMMGLSRKKTTMHIKSNKETESKSSFEKGRDKDD